MAFLHKVVGRQMQPPLLMLNGRLTALRGNVNSHELLEIIVMGPSGSSVLRFFAHLASTEQCGKNDPFFFGSVIFGHKWTGFLIFEFAIPIPFGKER